MSIIFKLTLLFGIFSYGFSTAFTQEFTCGGLLDGDESGLINYKLNKSYENDERCLWTIRAGIKPTIQVELLKSDFQICALCDFITIYTVNNEGQMVTSQKIFEADGITYNVTGPLIYISFTSNGVGVGTGFSLKYAGVGEDISLPQQWTYKLYFSTAESGQLGYPEESGTLFPAKEFFSFVLEPPKANSTVSLKVQSVDNGYSGIYCDRNILTVYECDLGHLGFRLRYCRTDDEADSRVTSPQPLLITFYSSVSQVGKGFRLSWNSTQFQTQNLNNELI